MRSDSPPLLLLLLLLLPLLASADYSKEEAWGKPCVLEISRPLMTSWDIDHVCPPMYYCFWDSLPFHVNGTTLEKTFMTSEELEAIAATAPEMENGKPAKFGYCDCNRFYAFDNPTDGCTGYSSGTMFFLSWSIVLVVLWAWLFAASLYTIYGFQKSQQWKWCSNASCQTLLHLLWTLPVMIAFQMGYVVTMTMNDLNMAFHNGLLSYMFSLGMMGFGICVLNIAVAWIEVVEKSQKKGQSGNTVLYRRGIYGTIFLFTFGIVFTMVILGNTSLAGAVVMMGLLFFGIVYRFAGNKLGTMLEGSGPKKDDAPKEMTMDVMVKGTAKEVSKLCLGILFLTVLFIMTTNSNVWLSTPGIEGGMTLAWYMMNSVLKFIRFGGRRAMIKAGLKPIYGVEQAKTGKLDVNKGPGSTTVESSVEEEDKGSGNKVAPA